ncbi:MAG: phosphotransferase [Rhodothermales bacterium]|nr:phosphotransferase [Rhodothermales bacterium]
MPSAHFDFDAPQPLIDFLTHAGWLNAGETVRRIVKAGEGNMNFVARVQTDRRSLVVKQSRPWVEKYPSIPAPEERILSEVTFYQAIQDQPRLAALMPRLLGVDAAHHAALFEDLGEAPDYTRLYNGERAPCGELRPLLRWLSTLHNAAFPETLRPTLANRAMRSLNHLHLFDFPLRPDNGLDLDAITPGLQVVADRLKQNEVYDAAVHALGERYLADGDRLLHGDFYPGSWVHTPAGPRIIDPEFAFFGPAEYDVGICLAHLAMAGYSEAERTVILMGYTPRPGFDRTLVARFAGMEIMRRLIGVAQLPLSRTIDQKQELLTWSEQLVLAPADARLY